MLIRRKRIGDDYFYRGGETGELTRIGGGQGGHK